MLTEEQKKKLLEEEIFRATVKDETALPTRTSGKHGGPSVLILIKASRNMSTKSYPGKTGEQNYTGEPGISQ